jgi:polysaccharide export outer membrane protein
MLLHSGSPGVWATDIADALPGMRLWPPTLSDDPTPLPPGNLQPASAPSGRTRPSGSRTDSISADDAERGTPSYVLGRGDQITITDYGSQDLRHSFNTQTATILSDGTASIYPIGVVHAAGQTLQQLNYIVNEKAKKYMVEPQLLVALSRARPVTVYVLGEVQNPGIYTLGANSSQSQQSAPSQSASFDAGDAGARASFGALSLPESSAPGQPMPETCTVLSALQKAGGLKDSANVRSIRVTHMRTRQIVLVDLWKLLVTGDVSQDIELEARDVVFVGHGGTNFDPDEFGGLAANQKRSVRIWGAVRTPGLYQLGPNDDVLSAIAKAGGFNQTAVTSSVLLSRVNRDGTVVKKRISIGRALRDEGMGRTPVMPGDVIIASQNPLLIAGRPLAYAGLAIAGAILVIYVSNRIRNINVINTTSGSSTNGIGNSNVRVAIPVL